MRRLRAAILRTVLLVAVATSIAASVPVAFGPAIVRADSPAPSAETGDTRSPGEAPGFVGAPLLAIGAVLALAAVAAVATMTYVRLTGGPGREPDGRPGDTSR